MKIPIYELATKEDHIAPASSVFIGSKLFGGPVRFVMAGSGHIAGVVNPPAKKKYQFWSGSPADSLAEWMAKATETPGSWWPDWARMACRAVGSQSPGARSRGRTAQADRRCARLLRAGAAVGPTGKHAARRPDSVRLAVAECDARVLCASSIAVIGTCLQWRGRASPRQSMASFRALGPLAFSS